MKLEKPHIVKNKPSKWSSMGGGMSKHYHSGMSRHKKFAIWKSLKLNREAKQNKPKEKEMFQSIKDLFKGYN